MSLNASQIPSNGGGKRVPQEELAIGNYMARLVQVIDTGVRYKEEWDPATNSYKPNTEKPPVQHIYTTYELLTEYMKDEEGNDVEDRPRWISEEFVLYNLGSDLATSTKRYNGIDPQHVKGGDWQAIAGDACQVALVHRKNGKSKIGGVASAIKGVPYPQLKNEVKVYTIDQGANETFGSLPEFLQEKIKSATNWTGEAVAPKTPEELAPQQPVQQPVAPAAPAVEFDDSNPF